MKREGLCKRLLVIFLSVVMAIIPSLTNLGSITALAVYTSDLYSYATKENEVVGTWSYWNGETTVTKTNKSLLETLPKKGSIYRTTTDNYDSENGAMDTSNWGTSFMWDLTGSNPYSMTAYAIPLAFRASIMGGAKNVIQLTAPSSLSDVANNTYTMQMPPDASLTDFAIQTSFATSSAKVDKVTDWSYEVLLENSGNANQYMRATMVQGSIFAYFELQDDDKLTILRPRSLPASVAYQKDNVLVIRCMDNMDEDYDYYAFYGAQGATFDTGAEGNMINSVAVQFASKDRAYLTVAYLGSTPKSPDDGWGASMCEAYLPYAYNFVTDTKATYSYNEATSTVTTDYVYTLDKKPESQAEGTIIGVLPHQYKNIAAGTSFLDYTYNTVRGTMKTIAGDRFSTNLKYSGILPYMPDYTEDAANPSSEKTAIDTYLQDYLNNFEGNYFKNYEGSEDTYWDGKGLNRIGNAIAAAEAAGNTTKANEMYTALKDRLEDWFTYSGDAKDHYFYYNSDVGSMFGFPQSYSAIEQINDHHFHYGYFIYAAAQVAMRDTTGTWINQYGGMVEELINDIACRERNSASSKYPYLRNFAPYEGHSWASGHANFEMGNNQESSSEALNAWAAIILWGEVTGNKAIRDLGIYLYTTEISAVQNYWYDEDEDVLSDAYRYSVINSQVDKIDKNTAKVSHNSAAIVWGGSYTYATWFSANPLYIQGINLLPMNPTCFYLAGDAQYIKDNYDLAYEKASASGWDMKSWVDIWCQYYAMAYPEQALAEWQKVAESYGVEGGETKAHTYHFIKTLCTYGVPDVSITSDASLSTVFVKDGVKTYCAYNTGDTALTVNFNDGYHITVPAHSMGVETEGDNASQAKYSVEYYLEGTNGSYEKKNTETKYGDIGATVTIAAEDAAKVDGYVFDEANINNKMSDTVADNGSTVLKLYYNRQQYTITYEMNSGINAEGNPVTYKYGDTINLLEPTRSGYKFTGWYTNPAMTNEITAIRDTDKGNMTLYAGWQDPFEYNLDANKKIVYEDGVLKVSVAGVKSTAEVLMYAGYYNSEAEAKAVTSDAGVGGLPGTSLTYNSTTSTWEATIETGFTPGQYMVFRINVIDGAADLSAWGVYEIPNAEAQTTITYYENFYQENLDGTYSLVETVKQKAVEGTQVVCSEKDYTGFEYNRKAENVTVATINSSSVTTLKKYYKRCVYTINYELQGGINAVSNPSSYKYGSTITLDAPTKADYVFVGWYTDAACTTAFAGIRPTTSGTVTVYAKWVTPGETSVPYTVQHYKQSAAGSDTYNLVSEDTENYQAVVGTTVYAFARQYDGYTENASHKDRVASGVVKEDGSLVLKLYYDVVDGGGYEGPENGGYTYADGKVTFRYEGATSGIVYVAVYSDEATAKAKAEAGNSAGDGGFSAVTGHAGYNLNEEGKYTHSIGEGKYFVYAFNPNYSGIEDWYVGIALGSGSVSTEKANYTVEHYKQDAAGSDTYTKVSGDTQAFTGVVGKTVTAEAKIYAGYTENKIHANRVAQGTVLADGSLVLKLYYDVNTGSGSGSGSAYPTPENGGYTYENGVVTFYNTSAVNGIVYVATYDTEAAALEVVTNANNAADEGFSAVPGHGGYLLAESAGRGECQYNIAEGKYFVYAMNPNFTGTGDWYIGVASNSLPEGPGEPEEPIDPSTSATYTVEHYKQTEAGSATYTKADTDTKTGTIGSNVKATAKNYTGYVEIGNHADRVAIGTVLADGSLVLKLYYDVVETGGYEKPENGGYTYDSATQTVKFNSDGATMVYVAVHDTESAAIANRDARNADSGEGLNVGSTAPGYNISQSVPVPSGKYFVYALKISDQPVGDWYVGVASTDQGGTPAKETATYTVKHFLQNTDLTTYTLDTTESLTGYVGESVTARSGNFHEFTKDEGAQDSLLTGTLASSGTLELKIYYNRNQYNITYANMEGATNAAANTAKYVYGVGLSLAAPTKSGYTFDGWYSDEGLTTQITEITTDATGAVIVYAKWTQNAATNVDYQVEHYVQTTDLTGYSLQETEDLSGVEGETVTAVVKSYTGFTHNSSASGTVLSGVLADGENLILKVYYDRNQYDITYGNMEGATNAASNTAKYVYGVGLTLAAPTKSGYTFGGWYTNPECTSQITTISNEAIGAITVYAKWTENEAATINYTVEHYVQNTDLAGYTLKETDNLSGAEASYVTATPKSYVGFTHNSEVEGTLLSGTLTEASTLVLKVYYDRNQYDITYENMEGATNDIANTAKYVYGVGLTLSEPTKDGYEFIGWYRNETLTTPITVISATETGAITVYAKWREVSQIVSYSVEHYLQNTSLDGYTKIVTQQYSGNVGESVDAVVGTYTGFVHNSAVEGTVLNGILTKDTELVLKVYYDREQYNITYENMEGATNAASNMSKYAYGVGLTLAAPTKEGYTFAGWYADELLQTPIMIIGTEKTGDVILYAKWIQVDNAVEYSVEYYQQNTTLDAYEKVLTQTHAGEDGDTVNANVIPYEGFTQKADATEAVLSGTLEKGKTLVLKVYYDRNQYSITYQNLEDAINPEDNVATYVYGVGLALATPTKEGYVFAGWYEDETFTKLIENITVTRAEDITVYAKWVQKAPEQVAYTVKYYLETLDGNYIEIIGDRVTGSDLEGSTVEAFINTYEGYVLNEEAEGSLLSGVLQAESELVLKVYYNRAEYRITYHNMEGAINPETNKATYVYGKGFVLAEPTKENSIFEGWYTDEDFTAENVVTMITDSQTGDVDLYAKWATELSEYTVKYYIQNKTLDGYEELTDKVFSVTAAVGKTIDAVVEDYVIEMDGFTFNSETSIPSGTVAKDTTLVLKLCYDRNTYTITYANMENATNAEENKNTYVYGIGLALKDASKENFVFGGWYLDPEFKEESKVAEIAATVKGNITVYAKWLQEDQTAEYCVEYYFQNTDLSGYTQDVTMLYEGRGEVGTKVQAPVKEFEGFAYTANAEGNVSEGILVKGEKLTLKLFYNRLSYSIQYKNLEEAVNNPANKDTYIYGVGMKLENPEKAGYVFAGWFTDEKLSTENQITEISSTQTGNVVVYAKWEVYIPEQDEVPDVSYDFTVDTIRDYYYTGRKIVPEIVVKDGDKVLTAKKDYTVTVKNNVNAGVVSVIVKGKGNYNGTVEKQFKILPLDISEDNFNVDNIYVAYKNGKNIKVAPKLTNGKKTLKLGKDYVIDGPAFYNQVGTNTVVLKGTGNYTGERTITFTVTNQILMSKAKIKAIPKQYYDKGNAIEPKVEVSYKGALLTENTDYTVEYFNNRDAGTATVVVTGTGEKFTGEKKVTFKIIGSDLKKVPIELVHSEFEYTGEKICPEYHTGNLQAGKDFTVKYGQNTKVGKGTVTFTGIGEYSGTVVKTFKIVPYNIANNVQNLFEDRTGDIQEEYVKGNNKPGVELFFDGRSLVAGVDYTLSYKNNSKEGKGIILMKGKGKYTGTVQKEFTITAKDIAHVLVMADDIVAKPGQKAAYYMAKLNVVDTDGKKLVAGKDYDKNNIVYEYTIEGETKTFDKKSVIGELPVGTELKVTVSGIGNYKGTKTQSYTVVGASIKSAVARVAVQNYTGKAITLKDTDITLTLKGVPATFEIVEDSYVNNINKGTAKVTLRGTGNYGGYKTISFKIGQRNVQDILAGIFKFQK